MFEQSCVPSHTSEHLWLSSCVWRDWMFRGACCQHVAPLMTSDKLWFWINNSVPHLKSSTPTYSSSVSHMLIKLFSWFGPPSESVHLTSRHCSDSLLYKFSTVFRVGLGLAPTLEAVVTKRAHEMAEVSLAVTASCGLLSFFSMSLT